MDRDINEHDIETHNTQRHIISKTTDSHTTEDTVVLSQTQGKTNQPNEHFLEMILNPIPPDICQEELQTTETNRQC